MEIEENKMEELVSEIAFIGEKLKEVSKYLRKLSNWQDSDEERYKEEEESE